MVESVSSHSNSLSFYDLSNGTDSQPLMFRYIENHKWKKLRRMLKRSTGKDMCRERDESGLTLLGMALGFEAPLDIIRCILSMDPSQITATDFFGASPLHVACLNAASLEAVNYLLQFCKSTNLAELEDRDNRVPLHHIVECLCCNEIDFDQGTKVIETLIQAAPDSIHASDKLEDSPIDLVQLARMEVRPDSKEYNRLTRLYFFLRGKSIQCYKDEKKIWEAHGPVTRMKKRVGSDSVATKSTKEESLTNSSLLLSTRITEGEMDISFDENNKKPTETNSTVDNTTKPPKGMLLKNLFVRKQKRL